jgi:hypothetical protein
MFKSLYYLAFLINSAFTFTKQHGPRSHQFVSHEDKANGTSRSTSSGSSTSRSTRGSTSSLRILKTHLSHMQRAHRHKKLPPVSQTTIATQSTTSSKLQFPYNALLRFSEPGLRVVGPDCHHFLPIT